MPYSSHYWINLGDVPRDTEIVSVHTKVLPPGTLDTLGAW
jgi:hypothetical protein